MQIGYCFYTWGDWYQSFDNESKLFLLVVLQPVFFASKCTYTEYVGYVDIFCFCSLLLKWVESDSERFFECFGSEKPEKTDQLPLMQFSVHKIYHGGRDHGRSVSAKLHNNHTSLLSAWEVSSPSWTPQS